MSGEEGCCKSCRTRLNGASIIPCGGILICSKCLHSKDANETEEQNTVLNGSFSCSSTVDRKNPSISTSTPNNHKNHNRIINGGATRYCEFSPSLFKSIGSGASMAAGTSTLKRGESVTTNG